MNLEVLLPYGLFVRQAGVARIVAETSAGSCGLLPQRLDCIAALVPGILTYQCDGQPEIHVAVDAGVLIKTGPDVLVAVRNAVGGVDLQELQTAVNREFVALDAQEQQLRAGLKGIEAAFIGRLASFHNE